MILPKCVFVNKEIGRKGIGKENPRYKKFHLIPEIPEVTYCTTIVPIGKIGIGGAKMIKIAVCDDIPCVAKVIKDLLIAYDFEEEIEVDCFKDGSQLYTRFVKKKYDILIIDIELTPDGYSDELLENGMLLADEIKEMYPETIVIFLSRYSYEKDLLRHEPFAFIDKPNLRNDKDATEDDKRIIENVEKAIRKIRNRTEYETMFWFKLDGVSFGKAIKEIVYFESYRPRIKLVSIDEEYIFRGRLDQVQEKIEKSVENFIRVSKSYYINMRYIKSYTSKEVTMMDNTIIPISRKYLGNFRNKIGDQC